MTSTPSRGDLSWLSQTLSWCCRLACPHSTIFLPNSESVPEKAAFSPALGSGDAAKHCTLGHVIFFFIRVPPQTQLALACTLWEGTPPSPLLTGSSNLEKWFSLRPPQLAQWKEGTHFLTQTPHLVQGHKYRDPFPVSPASALPTAQRERVGVRDGQFCAVSPWKLSRDTGNQARLVFSSRNLVPVPGQAKRAAATVCRRRKCCCLGVGVGSGGGYPVRDSEKTWGILKPLSVLVSVSMRSGLNRKKAGAKGSKIQSPISSRATSWVSSGVPRLLFVSLYKEWPVLQKIKRAVLPGWGRRCWGSWFLSQGTILGRKRKWS